MKLLSGLICAVLLTILGAATEAKAVYYVGNSTPAVVTSATIVTTCGSYVYTNIPPNTILPLTLPPGCTVTGAIYQGILYPTGTYSPLPPPNPPNRLAVTIARTVFTL